MSLSCRTILVKRICVAEHHKVFCFGAQSYKLNLEISCTGVIILPSSQFSYRMGKNLVLHTRGALFSDSHWNIGIRVSYIYIIQRTGRMKMEFILSEIGRRLFVSDNYKFYKHRDANHSGIY